MPNIADALVSLSERATTGPGSLRLLANSFCLDRNVAMASMADINWCNSAAPEQSWTFDDITSELSTDTGGTCLYPDGGGFMNFARLGSCSTNVIGTIPIGGGSSAFMIAATGSPGDCVKIMNFRGYDNMVMFDTCNSADLWQLWEWDFTTLSPPTRPPFQIKGGAGFALCWTRPADGSQIQLLACDPANTAQQWTYDYYSWQLCNVQYSAMYPPCDGLAWTGIPGAVVPSSSAAQLRIVPGSATNTSQLVRNSEDTFVNNNGLVELKLAGTGTWTSAMADFIVMELQPVPNVTASTDVSTTSVTTVSSTTATMHLPSTTSNTVMTSETTSTSNVPGTTSNTATTTFLVSITASETTATSDLTAAISATTTSSGLATIYPAIKTTSHQLIMTTNTSESSSAEQSWTTTTSCNPTEPVTTSTTDNYDSATSAKLSRNAKVIGGVLGSTGAMAVAAALFCFARRRKKISKCLQPPPMAATPRTPGKNAPETQKLLM
ncbi:hypothetical protein HDU88_008728 [Geranomyces variabilis]|nr:hypothetical protein HDU88_008728 [Geranomyces variabilis]